MKKPLLVAVVSAIAAALFASGYLSRKEAQLLSISQPVKVAVAGRDIEPGELLDKSMLSLMDVPRKFALPNAINDLTNASGRIAMVPIRSGSQISSATARLPALAKGLSGVVPIGRRAFSVGIDRASGVAGLLRPNDSVDVIATFDLGNEASVKRTTLTIVQDALVLAVGTRLAGAPEEDSTNRSKTGIFSSARQNPLGNDLMVTLAVTPTESQKLAFAQSAGELSISLKSFAEVGSTYENEPTTIGNIAGEDESILPFKKSFREYRGRR
ncbi:MAG: Flp pilus assembly protein CpaB [Pseudomonadota bacterium]